MAIRASIPLASKAGQRTLTIDGEELAEEFFGLSTFELGDDPHGPVMTITVLPPETVYAAHFHETDYVSIVLTGSVRVGRSWCYPGNVRLQEAESVYGPLVSGPEGCRIVNFYGDRTALPDQFASEAAVVRLQKSLPALVASYHKAGMLKGASPEDVLAQVLADVHAGAGAAPPPH
jgi:hypothetical protein